jgi:beta-propeller repeat-containing protein
MARLASLASLLLVAASASAGAEPRIALTLQPLPGGVEYRFDVPPGADPRAIRMRYRGADDVAVEGDGRSLRVRTGGRTLREQGLQCFQEIEGARRDVTCSYDVRQDPGGGFDVALALGPYDRTRALIIDPSIDWSSYLGGSNSDSGYGVTVDASANVYVTGDTTSSDFPPTGGFDSTLGIHDAFVTKVDGTGAIVWSTYLGGSSFDAGYGIALDSSRNVYVTGETWSADFPATGGFDTVLSGASDAFVTEINADGSGVAWSTFLGGSGQDETGNAITVDGSGAVYILGTTPSTDFPTTSGFGTSLGGMSDAFVTKINTSPAPIIAWSHYVGGSGNDSGGYGIAHDGMTGTYITGTTYSSDFPTAGGFDTSLGGVRDAFVAVVDGMGGALVWSSYLGGSSYDEGYGLTEAPSGDVYVTGLTASSDFPSAGGFDSTGSGEDAFVTKINPSHAIAWSSYLGGNGGDQGRGIALEGATENVYVVGYTSAADFPATMGFDTSWGGGFDAFVARIDAAGALTWSSYLGGSADDFGYGVAAYGTTVYVAGTTWSSDFPAAGGFDTDLSGMQDAFVTRIDSCSTCGDGCCGAAETTCNCPADCGTFCGDGCCNGSETYCTCPGECMPACGDGCCTASAGENACAGPGCETDCLPVCGDGCCTGGEDSCACPADCGSFCGDGCCTGLEDTCSCAADCGSSCGDGCCTGSENACTGPGCETDCPPLCGDGCCTGGEDACSGAGCDTDCPPVCGDGCCTGAETTCSCVVDCGSMCGDLCCNGGETACACASDCAALCGDGCCNGTETSGSCPTDCPPACGDTLCSAGETSCNCPGDCGSSCGDGCCNGSETACNCAGECPPSCGDGCCNGAETSATCSTDCPPTCGDSSCTVGETTCNCPGDCGSSCGDACCNGGEDCTTCPSDCGGCGDAGPEPMPDLGPEPQPDAAHDGAPDAPPDLAAQDPAPDAGTDAAADASPRPAHEGQSLYGCPCNVGRGPGSTSPAVMLAFLALVLGRRRPPGVG